MDRQTGGVTWLEIELLITAKNIRYRTKSSLIWSQAFFGGTPATDVKDTY